MGGFGGDGGWCVVGSRWCVHAFDAPLESRRAAKAQVPTATLHRRDATMEIRDAQQHYPPLNFMANAQQPFHRPLRPH